MSGQWVLADIVYCRRQEEGAEDWRTHNARAFFIQQRKVIILSLALLFLLSLLKSSFIILISLYIVYITSIRSNTNFEYVY